MSDKVYRVINNTLGPILLPFTPTFPAGVRLVCGANNVPTRYLDELRENKGAWAAFERMQDPERRFSLEHGTVFEPQITVMSKDADPGPEGPPLPDTLSTMTPSAAKKLIEITDDRAKLRRWAKDSRDGVSRAAADRLTLLGG